MDFNLSEEQRMLADTVRRLLQDQYGFDQRKAAIGSGDGWSMPLWRTFADLGLLGLHLPEDRGGLGAGPVETMLVATELGRALSVEPWIAAIVTGGGFLRHASEADGVAPLLAGIADGSVRPAFAQAEAGVAFDLTDVRVTARRDGGGWVLEGEKIMVAHGDSATHLIVTARVSGERRDAAGIAVFLIPADAAGLARTAFKQVDAQRAANVRLGSVRVDNAAMLAAPGAGTALVTRVVDETIAAQMAEALGCMEAAVEMTSFYLKERKQFGRPIGANQALQHRAADMVVAVEQSRSAVFLATMALSEADPVEARRNISAAKVEIARNGRFVGEQALQLHGGMGMAMEYPVGHYLKRLTVINNSLGNAAHHLGILARLGGALRAA